MTPRMTEQKIEDWRIAWLNDCLKPEVYAELSALCDLAKKGLAAERGVWVPRETIAPFIATAKRMEGYNEGLATHVASDVVKGRVVFSLDTLWVKHWRELLRPEGEKEG